MDEEKLKVYDNRYFKISKDLLNFSGLWPYKAKIPIFIRRSMTLSVLFSTILLCVNATRVYCGNQLRMCCENIAGIFYISSVSVKYVTAIICEAKRKRVYLLIAKNWLALTDPDEKSIITNFAMQGRLRGVRYFAYMVSVGLIFSQSHLIIPIMDIILPLNESRPKVMIVKTKYPCDYEKYYYVIYVGITIIGIASVGTFAAVDASYTIIVHQCLGIFSIVRHRIYKATENPTNDNFVCSTLISAIRLHQEALQFVDLIESSYNLSFLLIISCDVSCLSVGAILILESDDASDVMRMSMFGVGIFMHLLYLSWPGQNLIDSSENLYRHMYTNEWYNISEKAKTLIKIMMTCSIKPCYFTAGRLVVMSFQSYATLIKTAVSYGTVAVTFR